MLGLAAGTAAAGEITGQVRYEDRVFNASGFTGATRWLPVRQAMVEIVDAASGSRLAWGYTNESGAYSLTVAASGTRNVYLRVWAYADQAEARTGVSSEGSYYIAVSSSRSLNLAGGGTISLDIPISSGLAAVFNIFDLAVRSQQYMRALEQPPGLALGFLLIVYTPGQNENAYYLPGVRQIVLGGVSWNDDGFDDDTILHEIGHYVSFEYSLDHNPGGTHYLTEQYDPRLTWSEGWASFWAGAVREYVNSLQPGHYQDTHWWIGFWNGSPFGFERETPSYSEYAVYSENEMAVCDVLWDVFDPANEAHDMFQAGMQGVWRILRQDIPATRDPVTVEDFFQGLVSRYPGSVPAIQTLFLNRLIRFVADDAEAEDASGVPLAAGSTSALRTFYGNGDLDWFTVELGEGERLQVNTAFAKDGASPVFVVYDPQGAAVTGESGTVDLTVSAAGTYRIRARQTTDATRLADYGQYRIALGAGAGSGSGSSGGAPSSGGGGGGGGCGSVGLDMMAPLLAVVLWRSRRTRRFAGRKAARA